jgi:HlyD family secretion protein
MKLKILTAIAVAAAFAAPFAAQASVDTDNLVVAQAGGGGGGAGGAGSPGGAAGTGDTGSRPDSAVGTTAGSLFDRLDKNADGQISRDEAEGEARLNGRFVELDTNNDGKLSRSELQVLESEKSGAGTGSTGGRK